MYAGAISQSRAATDREISACSVFVMIGAKPNTAWLSDMVELDKNGFVLTGAEANVDSQYTDSDVVFGAEHLVDIHAGETEARARTSCWDDRP